MTAAGMPRTVLLVAAGYGAYLLYAYAGGALYFYIHPIYVVPVVASGAVLLVLALVAALPRRAAPPGGASPGGALGEPAGGAATAYACGPRRGHGCGGAHADEAGRERSPAAGAHTPAGPSAVAVALLVLPLALGFLLPPKPLGLATAATRGIDALPLGRVDERPEFRVEQRPETYSIKDWVKAIQADPEPGRHAGKPVRVTGFVYRDSRLPAGWFLVARFVVQCCAVDATPIGLPVRAADGKVPEAGSWVSVEGMWEVAEVRGERKAVIAPTAVTPTARPEQPYLY